MKWIFNGRVGLVITLIAPAIYFFFQNTGVHEVRRANDPVNFPIVDARPSPNDWPWCRGTSRANSALDERPPFRWNESEGNGWRVPIAGRTDAAPCLWGDRLYLSRRNPDSGAVSLICMDSSSGRTKWDTEIQRGEPTHLPPGNLHAASHPACDGEHVFLASVSNGSLWVTAVTRNGRIAWQREAGPYYSRWSYNSSPVIYKSLIIVAADNKGARVDRVVGTSYIAALHRKTGEIVWRSRRPSADSFGTPVVANIAGRDQLLMAGKGKIVSYDPRSGETLWHCRWNAERTANCIAFDDQHVFASARYPRSQLLCIRANGQGDVTGSHVIWKVDKPAGELPSPVVSQGKIYSLTDDGILGCLDATTGQTQWTRRLGGVFSSSPLIAGPNLYCCNEAGTVFVLKATGKGDLLTEIPLGEAMFTSPIAVQDRLYFRTRGHLHCVQSAEEAPVAIQPDAAKRKL
jgi:outer membrane protein assembly factor BamB